MKGFIWGILNVSRKSFLFCYGFVVYFCFLLLLKNKGECLGTGCSGSHCNPSYVGGRDRKINVQGQPRHKTVMETISQKYKTSMMVVCTF
jgi:hypothetical protein